MSQITQIVTNTWDGLLDKAIEEEEFVPLNNIKNIKSSDDFVKCVSEDLNVKRNFLTSNKEIWNIRKNV